MKYLTQSSNRKEQSRMMESRVKGNREEKWSCCLMGQVMGIEFQFCKMKRCKDMFHNNVIRNPMVVQRLGVHAFLSGAWVWFSTRKLSFKLHSTAKTMTTTTKQHCASVCVCVCISCSVVYDSLRSHGLQPTRLLCPWGSPGKNTRVGCHFFLQKG